MNKTYYKLSACCAVLLVAFAPITNQQTHITISEAQAEDTVTSLNRAERYLNSITTLTANFIQVAPDGSTAEGKLYLQRPGKMRWEYAPPTPILMVSNGDTFVYHDTELDEVSYLDLDDTLAAFIAKPHIDFSDDELTIADMRKAGDVFRFSLFEVDRLKDGMLTLVFRTSPMRLSQIIVADGEGGLTEVTLQNLKLGAPLDEELFIFRRSLIPTK